MISKSWRVYTSFKEHKTLWPGFVVNPKVRELVPEVSLQSSYNIAKSQGTLLSCHRPPDSPGSQKSSPGSHTHAHTQRPVLYSKERPNWFCFLFRTQSLQKVRSLDWREVKQLGWMWSCGWPPCGWAVCSSVAQLLFLLCLFCGRKQRHVWIGWMSQLFGSVYLKRILFWNTEGRGNWRSRGEKVVLFFTCSPVSISSLPSIVSTNNWLVHSALWSPCFVWVQRRLWSAARLAKPPLLAFWLPMCIQNCFQFHSLAMCVPFQRM
jgi:hypothetical protein